MKGFFENECVVLGGRQSVIIGKAAAAEKSIHAKRVDHAKEKRKNFVKKVI
jgi:hypothetical protein